LIVQLPIKFKPLLSKRARYKVFYGGRGSGKSRSIGSALIDLADKIPLRILCTREIQKAIKHSSKKLLEDEILRQKIRDRFHITHEGIFHRKTDSEFIFAGLRHNTENIKSMADIDIVWIEEARSVSQKSLDDLFPTIREDNSEIWISYNPYLDDDPVHKMFVVNEPPPGSIVVEVNHEDNPWFPDVLRDDMEHCKKHDIDKYNHIWRGQTVTHSHEQVFYGKWRIGEVPETTDSTVFYHGIDFGFSEDPTAAVRCFESEDGRTLYIDKESGGIRIELDDIVDYVSKEIETFKKWPSYGDNSRPETISHLRKKGFRKLKSCDKWPGSVEDGIEFMRSYNEIVVSEECKECIYEFTHYKHKKDPKTDDILPIIIDKNNHYMDALRYSLNKRITKKGAMKINPEALR